MKTSKNIIDGINITTKLNRDGTVTYVDVTDDAQWRWRRCGHWTTVTTTCHPTERDRIIRHLATSIANGKF